MTYVKLFRFSHVPTVYSILCLRQCSLVTEEPLTTAFIHLTDINRNVLKETTQTEKFGSGGVRLNGAIVGEFE